MRGLARSVISQWYTMISGLLLTMIAAALVFSLVPLSYTSSGTLVVMAPKRPTYSTTNPLLTLDSRFDALALLLIQVLSSPLLPARVGLVDGQDSVTVKNGGIGASSNTGDSQPFISITAQSPEAARSPAIVSWVIDLVRSDLAERQHALKVPKRNTATLQSVVDPTPAKPVWTAPVGATGGALLLGLVLTTIAAHVVDRAATRRQQRELASTLPVEGAGDPSVTRLPRPAIPTFRPAVVALTSGRRRNAS